MYVQKQKDIPNPINNSQVPKDEKTKTLPVRNLTSPEKPSNIKESTNSHALPLKTEVSELKKKVIRDFLQLKAALPEVLLERSLFLAKKHKLEARSVALALGLLQDKNNSKIDAEILKTAKVFNSLMNTEKIDADSFTPLFSDLLAKSEGSQSESFESTFNTLNASLEFLKTKTEAKDFTASILNPKTNNDAAFVLLPFAFREANVDFRGVLVLYLNKSLSEQELCSVYFKANAEAYTCFFSKKDVHLRASELGIKKLGPFFEVMKSLCKARGFSLHLVGNTDDSVHECNLHA